MYPADAFYHTGVAWASQSSVQSNCSKKWCSVKLCSVSLNSDSLFSVHGYARGRTIIVYSIRFTAPTGPQEVLKGFIC